MCRTKFMHLKRNSKMDTTVCSHKHNGVHANTMVCSHKRNGVFAQSKWLVCQQPELWVFLFIFLKGPLHASLFISR